jgi:hypothetical protein
MDVETKAGKSRTALHETGDGGAFVRKDSVYRGWIEEGGEFPPEGGDVLLQWVQLPLADMHDRSRVSACMVVT